MNDLCWFIFSTHKATSLLQLLSSMQHITKHLMTALYTNYKIILNSDQLAQLVEHRTTVREVVGSNPGRTTTQGL